MKNITPVYILEYEKLIKNHQSICERLKFAKVHYALKPNSEIPILENLKSINCNFEVASEGEFDKLRKLDVSPNRIICSLPVKKISTIKYLYKNECKYFVFDDVREFEKLLTFAPLSKKVLRIYIGDIIPNNIEYGITLDDFKKYFSNEKLLKDIDGITFYVLNNNDVYKLISVLERCEIFLQEIKKKNMILNIGGNYDLKENLPALFYDKLADKINRMIDRYGISVYAEPGRSIVKSAVSLLTEVVLIKQRDSYIQVFIDASSQIVKLKPDNVNIVNRKPNCNKKHLYKFYENLCSHYELFEMELEFRIEESDILVLENYGAYSKCFANGFHGAYIPETIVI